MPPTPCASAAFVISWGRTCSEQPNVASGIGETDQCGRRVRCHASSVFQCSSPCGTRQFGRLDEGGTRHSGRIIAGRRFGSKHDGQQVDSSHDHRYGGAAQYYLVDRHGGSRHDRACASDDRRRILAQQYAVGWRGLGLRDLLHARAGSRRNVGRPLRTQAPVDRCFDPVVGVHSVDRVRVGSRLADGHACDVRHQPGALSSGVVQGFG